MSIESQISDIPDGYSVWSFRKKKYGITKTVFNDGKSVKVYAEELGGKDIVSFNFYMTSSKARLKPCEMPEQKVMDFLSGIELFAS